MLAVVFDCVLGVGGTPIIFRLGVAFMLAKLASLVTKLVSVSVLAAELLCTIVDVSPISP